VHAPGPAATPAHLEKLKAQLVMLKRARYGHSSVKLGGEIDQGEAEIASPRSGGS